MKLVLLCCTVYFIAMPANAATIEMVQVPKGHLNLFWLSPTTKEAKKANASLVEVQAFQAMKYPVTVAQFKAFLKKNPKWKKDNLASLFADKSYLKSLHKQKSQAPVTEVSWYAANAFCEHHGMRLPTMNEWEYMAAASETKTDANKDETFLRRILDWYGKPSPEKFPNVGSVYKNKYGLWDTHGLIWEWVADFNSIFISGESREDESFNKNLFCGGGSMSGADKENYAAFMRFAFRSGLKGKTTVLNLGFRCVR